MIFLPCIVDHWDGIQTHVTVSTDANMTYQITFDCIDGSHYVSSGVIQPDNPDWCYSLNSKFYAGEKS